MRVAIALLLTGLADSLTISRPLFGVAAAFVLRTGLRWLRRPPRRCH